MSNAIYVQAIGAYIIAATYLQKDMGTTYITWLCIAVTATIIGGFLQKAGG